MGTREFTIVGPERRRPRTASGGRRLGVLARALLDGETVLLPGHVSGGNAFRTMRRHGYQLHSRSDPDGTVMWAEPIEEEKK